MRAAILYFDPVPEATVILVLLLLMGVFLIWAAYRRQQRFLLLRITLEVVSLTALAGFALRPGLRTAHVQQPVLLLTPGFDKTVADSLLKHISEVKILRTTGAAEYRGADALSDFNDIGSVADRLKFVVGTGLPDHVLDRFPEIKFQYFPPHKQIGISELSSGPFYAKRKNTIYGEATTGHQPVLLRLENPGGVLDSVFLAPDRTNRFSLSFFTPLSGQFTWKIVSHTGDVITTRSLPVNILPQQKLQILFLNHYPDAETRYLKNYLAETHHEAVLRYQVSANKFRTEFVNHRAVVVSSITTEVLSSFDLVLADPGSLGRLSASEKNNLLRGIESGLGLIVLPDQRLLPSEFVPFPGLSAASLKNDTLSFTLANHARVTLPALTTLPASDPELHSVTDVPGGRTVSAWKMVGQGRIGIQLLQDTWNLVSAGRSSDYSGLWSPLLEQTARVSRVPYKIIIGSPFPVYENDPLSVSVIGGTSVPPVLLADNIPVPVTENILIRNLWKGKLWPSGAGWHHLTIRGDSTRVNYFVSSDTTWKSLTLQQRRLNNKIRSSAERNDTSITEERLETISPVIFFILFLTSAALLWLLPKL